MKFYFSLIIIIYISSILYNVEIGIKIPVSD